MNQFETAKYIRSCILQTASEIMNYSWSSDFCFSELKNLEDKIKNYEWFNLINPTKFTKEQLLELEFVKWEDASDMYLIPLWIYASPNFVSKYTKETQYIIENLYQRRELSDTHIKIIETTRKYINIY